MWKRRIAILAQLNSKQATDRKLLADVIEPSMGERESFLRKGSGWALREFSKTDPDCVIEFIAPHGGHPPPARSAEARRARAAWMLDPPGAGHASRPSSPGRPRQCVSRTRSAQDS